jgi:hypothetical protein
MMIDESIKDIKTMHPTDDAIEEKEEKYDSVAEEVMAIMEDTDDFDGWNVELKEPDDNGSGLVARPSDVPITEPRKTLIQMLKETTANGELNPALQVTVSIAPIFQIDRPYKIKYNNISDQEFREMFWASHEHEVTAICVDYSSGGLAFVTGYNAFLDGIKTKSFYLSTADIDKYDIRFTPYCTYAEAVAEYEYKSAVAKEEKEN